MICPECGHKESRITDTRQEGEVRRRRHECLKCHKRFTTIEETMATRIRIVGNVRRDLSNLREQINRLLGNL